MGGPRKRSIRRRIAAKKERPRHRHLGQPDQARAWYEQGLALARRLGHPQVVVHALVRGLPLFHRTHPAEAALCACWGPGGWPLRLVW
jgi:hypothetical protein